MTDTRIVPLSAARQLIAGAMVHRESIAERVGDIVLRPHQRRAADRLSSLIASHGGALLAEPVGVGKTYIALALAAQSGGPVLIVVPSSLRAMWRDAATRCGLAVVIVSHESLSRGTRPDVAPHLVIVDEAHRLRSPHTRRYALLADLCRRARVLLVTATPVQNVRGDLSAQLGLFLGRVAWQMSDDDLARFVVRDSATALDARPLLDGPHGIQLDVDDDCLDLLLALPPPVPAKGESVAATLLTYGLLHQWTSSRAALVAALARRRARGLALMAALESGRRPTRAELSAWTYGGDALQLAFPEIVAGDALHAGSDDFNDSEDATDVLLAALDRHGAAIEALLRHLRSTDDPDTARADALRRIRAAHPGERIIAFCHYAETVSVLRLKLSRDAGIAALTARGVRIAGGQMTRDDVLGQFSPGPSAAGHDTHGVVDRVDLLITTDLLSEGLNLQEASVIVHLDLPWNPARLEQRVGRALRLGSRHDTVTVYIVAPPGPVEGMLRIESRLRTKLSVAQRTVGAGGRVLPSAIAGVGDVGDADGSGASRGLAEQRSAFDSRLRRWLAPPDVPCEPGPPPGPEPSTSPCAVAAAGSRADGPGFLALVRVNGRPELVADVGRGIETSTPAIRRAIAACDAIETTVDSPCAEETLQRLIRWLAARRGAAIIDLGAASAANSTRSRRTALTRVALALARAPRYERSRLAPLADMARAVASAPLAEGAERVLETLVAAHLPDEAWLRSLAAFGELNARPFPPSVPVDDDDSGIDVLIMLSNAFA